jgi:hypothetical protein
VAGEYYMEDPVAGGSNKEKHIRDAERTAER